VLVPQPTNDPNDPLNWVAWKKTFAFVSVGVFSGLGTWLVAGGGPALVVIMEDFDQSLGATIDGVINWCVLLMGVGVFLFSSLLI
jgi:hypothetical protein